MTDYNHARCETDDNDEEYSNDPQTSLIINFDHEEYSHALQQMLKRAGVNLPTGSAQGNESLVVNKLRRPLSHTALNVANDSTATNADNSNPNSGSGYTIPASSSLISTMQLVNCQIKDINILFNNMLFPKLSYLNLSFNSIKEISPPGIALSFANVCVLDISHNRINSLDFVSSLSSLKVLRCHYNQIDSLSPLQYLNNIEELWVSNNKIDWTQFIYLSNSIQLKKIVKCANPGDEKPKLNDFLVTIIPSLHIIDQEYADKYKGGSRSITSEATSIDSGAEVCTNVQTSKVGTDVRIMITQAKAMLKRDSVVSNEDSEIIADDDRRNKAKNAQRGSLVKSPSKKSIRSETPSIKEKEKSEDNVESASSTNQPKQKNRKTDGSGTKNLATVNADLDSMLEGIKKMGSSTPG